MKSIFDEKKGIEIIRYFVNCGLHDLYQIGKAMYFADLYHLSHYGFFIAGDRYIAMDCGPVPSGLYDLLKVIRSKKFAFGIEASGCDLLNSAPANLEYFSKSNIIALRHGINEVINLDFGKIKSKSHGTAYDKTDLNKEMKLTDIAEMFDNSAEIIEYIQR